MAKVRCKQTNADSFFGNFLYEQKVSRNHFLRKLNELVDWNRFAKKLPGYYKGKGETGQALNNLAIILKMLLLSYLWNVSERMASEAILISMRQVPSLRLLERETGLEPATTCLEGRYSAN